MVMLCIATRRVSEVRSACQKILTATTHGGTKSQTFRDTHQSPSVCVVRKCLISGDLIPVGPSCGLSSTWTIRKCHWCYQNRKIHGRITTRNEREVIRPLSNLAKHPLTLSIQRHGIFRARRRIIEMSAFDADN